MNRRSVLQLLAGFGVGVPVLVTRRVRQKATGKAFASTDLNIEESKVRELQAAGLLPSGDPREVFLDAVEDRLMDMNREWNRALRASRRS